LPRCSHAVAEDAVQAAVVYCLKYRARFDRLTPSYFIQLAVNNARMIRRTEDRRRRRRERGVGTLYDLARVEADDRAAHSSWVSQRGKLRSGIVLVKEDVWDDAK
jgi:DNA-directed RNA polymerase specialized sigma24 family protein